MTDIENRIAESTKKFEQKKAEREQHLSNAAECLEEMHRIQGEYRVLNELLEAEQAVKPSVSVKGEPKKGSKK